MNNDFVRRSDILELKRTLYRIRYATGCQSIEDTEAVEIDDIESIPTVDIRPVVRGHWIPYKLGDMKCSNCDGVYGVCAGLLGDYNYCPRCGADMKGVDNG